MLKSRCGECGSRVLEPRETDSARQARCPGIRAARERAQPAARAVETGVISINSNTSVRVSTPFGGFKQSGFGRELGPDALDHYTDVKNVFYATEDK